MGTFSEFLENKQINENQIVWVSKKVEQLKPKDRELYLKRRNARKEEKTYEELEIEKPRTGRGVSVHALAKAKADIPIPRKIRTKIQRAVNTILERRKKDTADLKEMFGDINASKGPPPKKAKKK